MVAVPQGYANPAGDSRARLQFICTVQEMGFRRQEDPPGLIIDPSPPDVGDEVSYRVLDPSGAEVVAATAVDLGNDQIRTGTFAPPISVPADGTPGTWSIEWTWHYDIGDEIREYIEETRFDVVASGTPLVNGYAQVLDARLQNVPDRITDDVIAEQLQAATELFDDYTGQFFSPRYNAVDYDVRGNGVMVQTDVPIIALNAVEVIYPDLTNSSHLITPSDLRIYNRPHRGDRSRAGVPGPDDRHAPKVELLRFSDSTRDNASRSGSFFARRFTPAQQNVTIAGWWGYTDPDGGPFGRTPLAVKRAVLRIALANLEPLWEQYASGETAAGPIVEMRTRQQTVKYATGAQGGRSALAAGTITGDPYVDMVIRRYRAPMGMRSA